MCVTEGRERPAAGSGVTDGTEKGCRDPRNGVMERVG